MNCGPKCHHSLMSVTHCYLDPRPYHTHFLKIPINYFRWRLCSTVFFWRACTNCDSNVQFHSSETYFAAASSILSCISIIHMVTTFVYELLQRKAILCF